MNRHQTMNKKKAVPTFISFKPKERRSVRRKRENERSPTRRSSLPAGYGGGGATENRTAGSRRRRSTMPHVTIEERESLPPLHEIALLLMPPKHLHHHPEDEEATVGKKGHRSKNERGGARQLKEILARLSDLKQNHGESSVVSSQLYLEERLV